MAAGDKSSLLLAGVAAFLQRICHGGSGGGDEAAGHKLLPFDPDLPDHQALLLTYADMVGAAYMAFAAGEKVLPRLVAGGGGGGYVATAHIYATIDAIPAMFDGFPLLKGVDKPYWFGYVAVARRAGFWDIVVAWRGSVTVADWMMNIRTDLVSFEDADGGKVAEGFYKVYTSMDSRKTHGELSAREQVVGEVARLVGHFRRQGKGVVVRVTVTGHSLGGALALMAAHDIAAALALDDDDVATSAVVHAVTFGAPHVGDGAFRDALGRRGVKVVRVAVEQDVVPRLPMGHGYVHIGDHDVELDVGRSPLKLGSHNLDLYLHLMSLRDKRSMIKAPPANGVSGGGGESESAANKKNEWPEMEEKNEHGYMRLSLPELDKLKVTKV